MPRNLYSPRLSDDVVRALSHLARWRGGDDSPEAIADAYERAFLRLERDEGPVNFDDAKHYRDQKDWQGLLLFHEYFHAETGESLGASHQTGWTSLIVRLVRQRIERKQGRKVKD